MRRCSAVMRVIILLTLTTLYGCQGLVPHDTSSLFIPRFQRSEIIGFLAGMGTTFAVVPDLVAMFRRRSSAGMNPRMATIIGLFQIFWVYYGLLIVSRPVIGWNVVGIFINFLSVAMYRHFVRLEKATRAK
jgi:MtN3 and saliva related transmembrane protein